MTQEAEVRACRECHAGYIQALSLEPAWTCPDHGLQRLSQWTDVPHWSAVSAMQERLLLAEDALENIHIQATGLGYEVAHRYFTDLAHGLCSRCGRPHEHEVHQHLMVRDLCEGVPRHPFSVRLGA